jgi:hypothetical protein
MPARIMVASWRVKKCNMSGFDAVPKGAGEIPRLTLKPRIAHAHFRELVLRELLGVSVDLSAAAIA